MKSVKTLYHGSSKKLFGGYLKPNKPNDLSDTKENKYCGVYAADLKDQALAMGIISGKAGTIGVTDGKVSAVIYDTWPRNKYFYLHVLSSEKFRNQPKGSHQWVSLEPIKPEKTERLRVDDYRGLVRVASKIEVARWREKFKKELRKRTG